MTEDERRRTDAEQARFLGLAIRSLLETVACQHVINRREFLENPVPLRRAYRHAETLVAKLHSMRNTIVPGQPWLREELAMYTGNEIHMTSGEDSEEEGSIA